MNLRLLLALISLLALNAVGCGGPAPVTVATPEDAPPPRATASLRLTDAEANGRPRNQIDLVVMHDRGEREVVAVGMVQGICTYDQEAPSGSLQQVRCWWAGEEQTLRLRYRGNAIAVIDDDGSVMAETRVEEGTEVSTLLTSSTAEGPQDPQ